MPTTRTEVPDKLYETGYFRFQIWIQRGQVTKIHLFSSRSKTKSLNVFFNVIKLNKKKFKTFIVDRILAQYDQVKF